MGFDDGWGRGIRACDASTFLGLVEDDVDRTDQGIGKVHRRDVSWEAIEFLEMDDDRDESLEKWLHMPIDEPAHPRTTSLALIVHEPNKFRILCDEVDMGADPCSDRRERVAALADRRRTEASPVEAASNLAEGLINRGLPELELAAEVVAKQAERYVRAARDLARRRTVETLLRKGSQGRIQDALAYLR